MTMLLTSTMMLTLDGVYQGPGGREEDTSGGFDRGGWVAPHFDDQAGESMAKNFAKADAFLLGRRTFEIFAAFWPTITDPDHPVAGPLNALPKYVASRTLKDPGWANTTVLDGDLVEAVRDLKAKPGNELQVHGSGKLVRFLLEHDLLDRLHLIVAPVILGAGERLFPEHGPDTRLELLESLTTPSGAQISTFRPAGRATYAEATA
jgi:dihydrofolate reductase